MAITKTQQGTGGTVGGASSTVALGFTAVAGRLLVAAIGIRESDPPTSGNNGWTLIVAANFGEGGGILAKIAAGGETTVDFNKASGNNVNVGAVSAEFTGPTLTDVFGDALTAGGSGGTDTAPAVTPTSGRECLIVGGFASGGFDSLYSSAGNGFTFVDSVVANGGDNPVIGMVYLIVASASGSYTPAIASRNQSHDAESAIFYTTAGPSARSMVVMAG